MTGRNAEGGNRPGTGWAERQPRACFREAPGFYYRAHVHGVCVTEDRGLRTPRIAIAAGLAALVGVSMAPGFLETGRDVDVLFYLTDSAGRPQEPSPALPFPGGAAGARDAPHGKRKPQRLRRVPRNR